MLPQFDENTCAAIAAKRAEIAAAQAEATAFARDQMDPVSDRLAEVRDGQHRLGPPPVMDAFATAADWRQASDQHSFDSRFYEREAVELEQRLNALRDEHTRLLAELAPLHEALWRTVLAAVHAAAVAKLHEAAQIAAVHKSLVSRLPQNQWHWGQPEGQPVYQVQGSAWPDISKFVATVVGDGFGPDKSEALVAELGL